MACEYSHRISGRSSSSVLSAQRAQSTIVAIGVYIGHTRSVTKRSEADGAFLVASARLGLLTENRSWIAPS